MIAFASEKQWPCARPLCQLLPPSPSLKAPIFLLDSLDNCGKAKQERGRLSEQDNAQRTQYDTAGARRLTHHLDRRAAPVIRAAPAIGGRVPPNLLLQVLLERAGEIPGRRRGPRVDVGVAVVAPVIPGRLPRHPPAARSRRGDSTPTLRPIRRALRFAHTSSDGGACGSWRRWRLPPLASPPPSGGLTQHAVLAGFRYITSHGR